MTFSVFRPNVFVTFYFLVIVSLQSSYSSSRSVCSAAENTVLILFDSLLSHSFHPWSSIELIFFKPAGSAPCRTHCHHWPWRNNLLLLHACFNLGHLSLCKHTQTCRRVDVCVLPAVVGVMGMPGKTSPSLFPLLVTMSQEWLRASRPNYWISMSIESCPVHSLNQTFWSKHKINWTF